MCLFDVLLELSAERDYRIYPVHVNHKLRPGDAERDQEFVEEICRRRGLVCRTFVVDCNKLSGEEGLTSEEAGRKARYEAFFAVAEQIAKEIATEACEKNEAETQEQVAEGVLPEYLAKTRKKIVIAVAQNANDQAETILFRILRGTGTDGLAGIAYKRYERGIPVVRPLLDVPREEIEKYCQSRNLSPRIDHTNKEAIYARNKIRLELLPLLREKFNPNILETLDRLGKNAAIDRDYLRQQAEAAYHEITHKSSKNDRTVEADVSKLSALHKAVRIRLYNRLLAEIGMTENISEGQLKSIEKVRLSQSPSAMCDLSEGYAVYKEYEKLLFCRKEAKKTAERKYKMRFISPEESAAKAYAAEKAAAENHATGGAMLLKGLQEDNLQDSSLWDSRLQDNLQDSGRRKKGESSVVGVFVIPSVARDSICIRKRRDGDVIAIGTGTGSGTAGASVRHKKLQDFFVDAKVPKNKRDEIDLLAYGNKILWALPSPYFASEQYRKKGRFSAEFRLPDFREQKSEKSAYAAGETAGETAGEIDAKTILILEIL